MENSENQVNVRPHSVKVPRLYKVSSEVYRQVKENGSNLKDLVFKANHPLKKAIYALVLTAIQRETTINHLLKKTDFLKKESGIKPHLAKILMTELLWGKKSFQYNDSKPIATVSAYHQQFLAHSNDFSDFTLDVKQECTRPRFVRVNTILCSMQEAVEGFRDEGWILKRFLGDNYDDFISQVANLQESEFMVDLHVENLLIFPPRTEFFRHEAYKCGQIILQDKASCLPCVLLNPPKGSRVLDMCAAPGMKTTQLVSMVGENGFVYAVERDPKRMGVLKQMVDMAGATDYVTTILKDCLKLNGKDLDVEYIIVDPSCSGSGLTDRLEVDPKRNDNIDERLNKLKGFQALILKHALRSFPKVKRVVYSTCSIYPQENEEVVRDVLNQVKDFKLVPAKNLIKSWKNFGNPKYTSIGENCLYANPEDDLCTGFFVAVFERISTEESNEKEKIVEQTDNETKTVKTKKKKKKTKSPDE